MAFTNPSTPDPFNAHAVKTAMARRVVPLDNQSGINMRSGALPQSFPNARPIAALPSAAVPRGGPVNYDPAADVAAHDAAPTPPTPSYPSMASISTGNNAALDNANARAGMGALPAGVVRASVPGLYEARTRGGTTVISDDPNSDVFHGSREPATSFAGTQVDPRFVHVTPDGWVDQPGVGAFSAPATDNRIDARAMSRRTAADPTAGYAWAHASGGTSINDITNAIENSRGNPVVLQERINQMQAAIDADPNQHNPQIAASNNAAMQRLMAARSDAMGMARRNDPTMAQFADYYSLGQGHGGAAPGVAGAAGTGAAGTGVGATGMTGIPGPFGKIQSEEALNYGRAGEASAKGEAATAGSSQGQQKIDNAAIQQNLTNIDSANNKTYAAHLDAMGIPHELDARFQYLRQHPELAGSPFAHAVATDVANIVRNHLATAGNGYGASVGRFLGRNEQPVAEAAIDPQVPFGGLYRRGNDLYGQDYTTDSEGNSAPEIEGSDPDAARNVAHIYGPQSTSIGDMVPNVFGVSHRSVPLTTLLTDPNYGPYVNNQMARSSDPFAAFMRARHALEAAGAQRRGQQQ